MFVLLSILAVAPAEIRTSGSWLDKQACTFVTWFFDHSCWDENYAVGHLEQSDLHQLSFTSFVLDVPPT